MRNMPHEKFLHRIEEALEAGVDIVQFRNKELNDEQFEILAIKVLELCNRYNIPLIINDRLDIAIKIGAHGAHCGQSDEKFMSLLVKLRARECNEHALELTFAQKTKHNLLYGISVYNYQEAIDAIKNKVDYISIGPVFNTKTKKDARASLGIETLYKLINEIKGSQEYQDNPCHIMAIGGIIEANIGKIIQATDSVAIIGEIMDARDIQAKIHDLKNIMNLCMNMRIHSNKVVV